MKRVVAVSGYVAFFDPMHGYVFDFSQMRIIETIQPEGHPGLHHRGFITAAGEGDLLGFGTYKYLYVFDVRRRETERFPWSDLFPSWEDVLFDGICNENRDEESIFKYECHGYDFLFYKDGVILATPGRGLYYVGFDGTVEQLMPEGYYPFQSITLLREGHLLYIIGENCYAIYDLVRKEVIARGYIPDGMTAIDGSASVKNGLIAVAAYDEDSYDVEVFLFRTPSSMFDPHYYHGPYRRIYIGLRNTATTGLNHDASLLAVASRRDEDVYVSLYDPSTGEEIAETSFSGDTLTDIIGVIFTSDLLMTVVTYRVFEGFTFNVFAIG